VFLLPTISQISVIYANSVLLDAQRTPFLFNKAGQIRCSYFDLFWKEWCNGNPPSVIGSHEVNIDLQDGYFTPVGGKLENVTSLNGIIQVEGLVMAVSGQAQQHLLVNQADRGIERLSAHATFTPPKGKQILVIFHSEEELQKHIAQQHGILKISVGRNRLPRMKAYSLYWPLSQRVGVELIKAFVLHQQSETEPFNIANYAHLEGTDIRAAWEPIWDQNPIIRELVNP
jgi:hypothetical protein